MTSTLLLALALTGWAASPAGGAAHSYVLNPSSAVFNASPDAAASRADVRPTATAPQATQQRPGALPAPARFQENDGRGLLVKVWVNGTGAYTFAIDTGAGATILSPRVAGEARATVERGGRDIAIGGLSGLSVGGGQRAYVRSLAVGFRENLLPAGGLVIIARGLPPDLDGILDPTEAFWPLGYVIDLPAGELSAFDPRRAPVRTVDAPPGGAVVPWLSETGGRRPFVLLSTGQRALLDTGSGFGLAVTAEAAGRLGVPVGEGRERAGVRDLAGGRVGARRIRPATVYVGSLELRNVPTDLLSNTGAGSPVLLGRAALRPFRLTFDPLSRLIMFGP